MFFCVLVAFVSVFFHYLCKRKLLKQQYLFADHSRMRERIEHSGIVEHVGDGRVTVRIVQSSACGACEARQLCQSSESKEKLIDCRVTEENYTKGEHVMVYGSMSMGRDAVLIAFVLPLVLVVVWLFLAIGLLQIGELVAIGVMVLLLVAYYLTIRLFNRRLSRKFEFWIEKIV